MYEAQGVTPDKEIIAHCQLGIRAAHTWFVLKHVLGYPNVKNYDGSWQEWGNRDDLPIEPRPQYASISRSRSSLIPK